MSPLGLRVFECYPKICVYLRSFHPGEFRGCGWFVFLLALKDEPIPVFP
jgi:hypothetical protein